MMHKEGFRAQKMTFHNDESIHQYDIVGMSLLHADSKWIPNKTSLSKQNW